MPHIFKKRNTSKKGGLGKTQRTKKKRLGKNLKLGKPNLFSTNSCLMIKGV